jgi:hypothetical protein
MDPLHDGSMKTRDPSRAARTEERRRLLDPNAGSDIKIETYQFCLAKKVALGVPCSFKISECPDVPFRITRLVAKVPRGMFLIEDIRVANICGLIGSAPIDAAALEDLVVDYPTITPANRVMLGVYYTGLVPGDLTGLPVEEPTMATILGLLQELESENSISMVHARIKGIIEKIPTFMFSAAASGPASMCG